jgi:hypothetical protein
MRYFKTLVDTAHKGQHVDKGTVLAFDEESDRDMGAVGNYLAAGRAVEVDEDAYVAARAEATRRAKDAARTVQQ